MSSLQVRPRTRSANIFINYRREDSAGHAGRLFDALSDHFAGRLFMDVDTLEPGVDFVDAIEQAVGSCEALIVVIGRQWLTIEDKTGRRRLDDPGDFVRLEVESALARKIRVIPVLVQDAAMPRADELPPTLARLARRNAIELSDARWAYDVDRLAKTIQEVLEQDGILARPVATPPATPQLLVAAEPVAEAGTARSRAWIVSLAALALVAVVGLASVAWVRWTASANGGVSPLPAGDKTLVAAGVPGISAAVPTPASAAPTPTPASAAPTPSPEPSPTVAPRPTVAPSNEYVPASTREEALADVADVARKGVELFDRIESAAGNSRDDKPARRSAAVPAVATSVPEREGELVPSRAEMPASSAASAPPRPPVAAATASRRPLRATILSPRNGEVVGTDVIVQGLVFGLVDQQIFLGIRQKNGRIYPRGELFPNGDGQWSIKLRSSKEKTFEILVMTSIDPQAAQVLRDQRSRDDGLAVMPDGASISSDVVALKRQGRIVGILNPKEADR